MMDLDRFKDVNDSLGHHAGDALLVEIGKRLRGILRSSDTVARLGGDEFGVLISKPRTERDVVVVIEKIRAALERPVTIDGLALPAEGSIGIAMFPHHGEDVDTLLRHADVAMYGAKEEKGGYAFYEKSRNESDPARLTLVSELRRAIEERELVLYYQPKAELANGAVQSVEALLRWNHPTRGLVGPDEFIPLAQQTGLIKPLTLYVLDEALSQCRAWQRAGMTLSVAVNLSVRNLLDADFPDQVKHLLKKRRVDPSLLELEITESTMLSDPVRTKRVLDKLVGDGSRALDRRLRHRLFIAGLPEPAAGQRDQDRPLVRDEHGRERQRRRDRALDDRPRPQPRPPCRRRGRRDRAGLGSPLRARVHARPGLLPEPAGTRPQS